MCNVDANWCMIYLLSMHHLAPFHVSAIDGANDIIQEKFSVPQGKIRIDDSAVARKNFKSPKKTPTTTESSESLLYKICRFDERSLSLQKVIQKISLESDMFYSI